MLDDKKVVTLIARATERGKQILSTKRFTQCCICTRPYHTSLAPRERDSFIGCAQCSAVKRHWLNNTSMGLVAKFIIRSTKSVSYILLSSVSVRKGLSAE